MSIATFLTKRYYPLFSVDPRRKELFDNPEKQLGINKIISRLHLNGGLFSVWK